MNVHDLLVQLADQEASDEVFLHAPVGPAPLVRIARDRVRDDESIPGVTRVKTVVVLSSR